IKGNLKVEALRRSLDMLATRHEALRTTFLSSGEYQQVAVSGKMDVPLIDLSALPEPEKANRLAELLRLEARENFRLSQGPLTRVKLVKLEDESHILVFVAHHIICDGWS